MSRNSEYQFISTDTNALVSQLTSAYEALAQSTVRPASPERLFIQWVASIIVQERALNNWTANQNIPSRAEGENLDALAELYLEQSRPEAKAAVCTMRFTLSAPQPSAVLIPAGTRVTDKSGTLVWATEEDAYVKIGESSADVPVRCQTAGLAGNGYAAGQIDTLVDVFAYYSACRNITASGGGADRATDEEFYELMRLSMDGYSCAGAMGGYAYFAKRVSTEIADVVPNSPSPGVVFLYVLMDGGQPAGEEVKRAVLRECSGETVRAFTDDVHMGDPETVPYDIDLTYYVREGTASGSGEVQAAVERAVEEYQRWQSAKLGRDINPSKLYHLLMEAGVKRVDLRSPAFTRLRDGKLAMGAAFDDFSETVPQVAAARSVTIVNGGYEDE